jgi:hypothetical protein
MNSILESIEYNIVYIILAGICLMLVIGIIYALIYYLYIRNNLNGKLPIINGEHVLSEVNGERVQVKVSPENKSNKSNYVQPYLSNAERLAIKKGLTFDQKYTLFLLMSQCINALSKNVHIFTHPTFYTQKITDLIINNTWYLPVIKFAKYTYNVPGITSDVINNAMIDHYGSLSSPSLYASYSGITYYLPLEFDPAIELYVKNRKYLDSIIT